MTGPGGLYPGTGVPSGKPDGKQLFTFILSVCVWYAVKSEISACQMQISCAMLCPVVAELNEL